jgi:class 3 adenylate cyclase/tetratricopeptide (TPR) repeat protein
MQCPKCRFDNPEDAKFCNQCAAKLELTCPQCGKKNPSGSKFCNECSQALSEPPRPSPPSAGFDQSAPKSYTPKHLAEKILTTRTALEGERKLVTVLFVDVARFTALSEKLEPEEVHRIMEGCLKILMDEIHRYEGTINQFTGDGVMALFGAPLAHEDHAQRACRAALAIQKGLVAYEEKIRKDFGQEFRMRIGLNSGPVVVGAIGDDLHMDYTAIGDTINLASRVQTAATPGEVWLSHITQDLIQNYFENEPKGEVFLKGKGEPQKLYRLIVDRPEVRTRFEAGLARGVTELVGRRPEMESLRAAFDRAKNGEAQVMDVVGEAGVGKSRLIYEFHKAVDLEALFLSGVCLQYGRNINFLAVRDVVREAFNLKEGMVEGTVKDRIDSQAAGQLRQFLPFYHHLLSLTVTDSHFNSLSPEGRKFGTFEAVKNFLLNLSQQKPLVVFLEDVHWMDKLSEEFFTYLSRCLHGYPVMMLSAYRPEVTPPWAQGALYQKLGLETLGRNASIRLVINLLGGLKLAPALEGKIAEKAGGNPFFMEEIVRELLERGDLVREENQYVCRRPLDQIEIPSTIQGVIAARMDRLSEDLKRTTQVASVIGRDFAFKILQSVMKLGEELRGHLTNLVGLELLYEKALYPELEYIFKHSLTQNVAYESLLKQRRREIHGRIARAIEELYAEKLEPHYETLAHHYELSGEIQPTLKYLILAGEKSYQNMAIQSSDEFFTKAIQIGESHPEIFSPEDRAKCYFNKGGTALTLGEWSEWIGYFIKCNEISREHELVEYEMNSLKRMAVTVYFLESEQEADDVFMQALTRARHFKDLSLESIALSIKALRIALYEDPLRGYQKILQSQEIALKSSDPVAIGAAGLLKANIERWLGQPGKAIASSEGFFDILMAVFDYPTAISLIILRGMALAEVGRISEAIKLLEMGIDITLKSNASYRLSTLYNCLGFCYSEICLPEKAWELNRKSESISGEEMRKFEFGRRQHAEAYAQARVNLMENLFDQGMIDRAWDLLDPFKVQTKSADFDMGRIHQETRLGYLEGRLLIQKGELDQAEKLIMTFLESSEKKGLTKRLGGFLRLLGEVQMKRREPGKAIETLNKSVEILKKVGNHRQLWTAHTSLASAYERKGKGSEAREQWQVAKGTAEGTAQGIEDETLKKDFLDTEPIREIFTNAAR